MKKWQYFAVLALLAIDPFAGKVERIQERLGFSITESEDILIALTKFGLVTAKKKELILTDLGKLYASSIADFSSQFMTDEQVLSVALEKIYENNVDEMSYFESTAVAISKTKLFQAKELVDEFRRKLCVLLEKGEKDEVYMIGIQFFPVSK